MEEKINTRTDLEEIIMKKEVEDKINTRTDLEEIIIKKEVEDKIDTAAVTVADAIRELEFKLEGKKQIVRKARTKT